ncbi:MAG: cupin domain-containing protein [Alphaproteobacteria bacterium]|nr:cupin domain-containing protein [Alphaproteobacteria bacterium]
MTAEAYMNSPSETDKHATVGSTIKQLRKERKLSLQQLSKLSDVSVGMLSQIERDLANPSLKVMAKIQTAFGIRFSAFYSPHPQAAQSLKQPKFVCRKDHRPRCELGYLTKELLSTPSTQNLEIMMLSIPPNGSSGDTPFSTPSEKGGLVLEGEIVITVGGNEARLTRGDSFSFDGKLPHTFRNDSESPAIVLWIISNFPIERHL